MEKNLLLEALKYVYYDHKNNLSNLYQLAKENTRQQTLRTSLGIGWVFFRDMVYFGAFIIFRYLMAGSSEIDGMNFTLYLMVGLIPWNFMNECMNGAVGAIKKNKPILSSMKFPVVTLPTIEVSAIFLKRLFTLLILLFVVIAFGDIRNVTWWMFIYYFASMFIFMCIWNLIFSSLVAISNDFEQFYGAIVSVLFFVMPILWSFENLKPYPWIIRLFKLNPFVYIVEGFRDAVQRGELPDLQYTIYFWGLSFVLICIGSILQYKLKNHYIDLI